MTLLLPLKFVDEITFSSWSNNSKWGNKSPSAKEIFCENKVFIVKENIANTLNPIKYFNINLYLGRKDFLH